MSWMELRRARRRPAEARRTPGVTDNGRGRGRSPPPFAHADHPRRLPLDPITGQPGAPAKGPRMLLVNLGLLERATRLELATLSLGS